MNIYKALGEETYKMSDVYLQPQSLDSDNGFLFESHDVMDTVSFDYIETDDSNLTREMCLISMNIMSSNNSFIIEFTLRYQLCWHISEDFQVCLCL